MNKHYQDAEFGGQDPDGSPLLNKFAESIGKVFPPELMHARCQGDELIIQSGTFTAWISEDGTLNGAANLPTSS